jgi:hypothetical protein
VIVALVLLALAGPVLAADPPRLPEGVTCEVVRQYVAQHGQPRALAWAIEQGYSWREIRAARRCLRG